MVLTAGAAPARAVYDALMPGSEVLTGVQQLTAGRGSFIFKNGGALNVGILGFVSQPSNESSPRANIIFTYGEAAGTAGFIPIDTLFAQGWRLAAKSQNAAIYAAGAVTKMPDVITTITVEALGSSIEALLAAIDEAAALAQAGETTTAQTKLAAASALISDTDSLLKLMLDAGRISRDVYGSISETLKTITAVYKNLKDEIESPRGAIESILSSAAGALDKLFGESVKETIKDSNVYAERAESIKRLAARSKELAAILAPFRNDRKISPLLEALVLDQKVLDEAVQKISEDEKRGAGIPLSGYFRGLGADGAMIVHVGKLAKLGRVLKLFLKGGITDDAAKIALAEQIAIAKQLGLYTPSLLRRIAGWTLGAGSFFAVHILPMWYFFSPNSWANKEAALEAEKRATANLIATRRLEELLAQGVASKDALIKVKEYMKEIENQLDFDIKNYPELTTLEPHMAIARAAIMAKAKQSADAIIAKATVEEKGTSPIVWILGAGAVALILYLIISGKKEVPVARLAKPAKR
jgi:hypothetical protein